MSPYRIVGLGHDITSISRFRTILLRESGKVSDSQQRFLQKFLSVEELQYLPKLANQHITTTPTTPSPSPSAAGISFRSLDRNSLDAICRFISGRWSLKESLVKACGIRLFFPHISILSPQQRLIITSSCPPSPHVSSSSPSFSKKYPLLSGGRPEIRFLSSDILPILKQHCGMADKDGIFLSLSHDGDFVSSTVILQGPGPGLGSGTATNTNPDTDTDTRQQTDKQKILEETEDDMTVYFENEIKNGERYP